MTRSDYAHDYQVEPKTPDLEDFAISSVAIRLLNTDDVENSSPNAPHAISLLSKVHPHPPHVVRRFSVLSKRATLAQDLPRDDGRKVAADWWLVWGLNMLAETMQMEQDTGAVES